MKRPEGSRGSAISASSTGDLHCHRPFAGTNLLPMDRLLDCLRRGLGLKDGPGSAKPTVSVRLGRWFILSPSARTGLADLASRAKVVQTVGCSTFTREAKPATRRVADGERMNPQGKAGAYAPMQETTSTRATSVNSRTLEPRSRVLECTCAAGVGLRAAGWPGRRARRGRGSA